MKGETIKRIRERSARRFQVQMEETAHQNSLWLRNSLVAAQQQSQSWWTGTETYDQFSNNVAAMQNPLGALQGMQRYHPGWEDPRTSPAYSAPDPAKSKGPMEWKPVKDMPEPPTLTDVVEPWTFRGYLKKFFFGY